MYRVLPRILLVDDDRRILDAMAPNLRRHFDVTLAEGGEEGLDRVEHDGPFAVVLSDQRMPGMDGVTFLARVRENAPETVRILLTGYADTAAAMSAVNRGAVFRFLGKPIEFTELLQTLKDAVEQHRLMTAERVLLERTLHGSISAIIDVLALVNPEGFGRAQRAKRTIATLAEATGSREGWQVEVAAMISQVGSLVASSRPGQPGGASDFKEVENAALGRLSRIAADMVANIPRMEEVHAILSAQDLNYDGSNGGGRSLRGEGIPMGARMLRVAFDLDELESRGMSREDAVEVLRRRDGWYDPTLLNAARGSVSSLAEPGRAATPTARDSEPAMADSVDCGGMTLDLTMRLTV